VYVHWKLEVNHRKSSYINTDLFASWFTEHFLIYIVLGKVILHLDCHRTYCIALYCYRLLLTVTLLSFSY